MVLDGPPKTIVVAVVNALFVSTDDGQTWSRQDTRQAFATLILRGIRATLVSGARLNPRALTAVRMIAEFFGEEAPASPGPITSPPRRGVEP